MPARPPRRIGVCPLAGSCEPTGRACQSPPDGLKGDEVGDVFLVREPFVVVLDAPRTPLCAPATFHRGYSPSARDMVQRNRRYCNAKVEELVPIKCRPGPRSARFADGMRWSAQTEVAITNGGGIRGRQGLSAGLSTTWRRRARRAAVRQPARHIRRLRRRAHGRDRERALEAAEPQGLLPSGLRPQHRGRHQPPARQPHYLGQGRQRSARSRQDLLARYQ